MPQRVYPVSPPPGSRLGCLSRIGLSTPSPLLAEFNRMLLMYNTHTRQKKKARQVPLEGETRSTVQTTDGPAAGKIENVGKNKTKNEPAPLPPSLSHIFIPFMYDIYRHPPAVRTAFISRNITTRKSSPPIIFQEWRGACVGGWVGGWVRVGGMHDRPYTII